MTSVLNGAVTRILLRYSIGIAVGAGWLGSEIGSQISTDPDVIALVDYVGLAVCGALIEGWYWLAKRWGWAT